MRRLACSPQLLVLQAREGEGQYGVGRSHPLIKD